MNSARWAIVAVLTVVAIGVLVVYLNAPEMMFP